MKLLTTALIVASTLASSYVVAGDASGQGVYRSCDHPELLSYAELETLGISNFYQAKQAQGHLQLVVKRACKRSEARAIVLVGNLALEQGKVLAIR